MLGSDREYRQADDGEPGGGDRPKDQAAVDGTSNGETFRIIEICTAHLVDRRGISQGECSSLSVEALEDTIRKAYGDNLTEKSKEIKAHLDRSSFIKLKKFTNGEASEYWVAMNWLGDLLTKVPQE